ncbi:MAG: hypothetical protein DI539_28845 [Flavobacterium psychrophilum]|nr:MAG: hypothetical protein DI539_28845 [Flavobacterium psychrophilum]
MELPLKTPGNDITALTGKLFCRRKCQVSGCEKKVMPGKVVNAQPGMRTVNAVQTVIAGVMRKKRFSR